MRELVFALEFKGSAAPVPGSPNRLHAKTSATGQTFRTALKSDGVQSRVESVGGDTAKFESEVEMLENGAFLESGSIEYGAAGRITFQTVGRGALGPSPLPNLQRGSVMWEVTGGDGVFRGAQGLITSNFTVSTEGEVTDDHFVRLFLPE
jgi:hypothetical protein